MKSIDFIKIAIKDYKTVGAVMLSSKYVIKKIVKQIKPEYKYIVEYGAGNGVITREILKVLPKDGRVVAIELNKPLFHKLAEIKDSRLIVLNGDIVKISGKLLDLDLPRIDAIISGIPFSFIKPDKRKEVLANTYQSIADGGRIIIYQTSLLVLPKLKKLFEKVKYSLELRNLPPFFIIVGDK
jgi:phospholipid N-methyltransferase